MTTHMIDETHQRGLDQAINTFIERHYRGFLEAYPDDAVSHQRFSRSMETIGYKLLDSIEGLGGHVAPMIDGNGHAVLAVFNQGLWLITLTGNQLVAVDDDLSFSLGEIESRRLGLLRDATLLIVSGIEPSRINQVRLEHARLPGGSIEVAGIEGLRGKISGLLEGIDSVLV